MKYFGVGSLQWQIRNVSRLPLPDDRPFRAPPHEADDDIPLPASVAWSPRVVLPPQPEPSDGSSQRWSEMNNFKGTSFDDRLTARGAGSDLWPPGRFPGSRKRSTSPAVAARNRADGARSRSRAAERQIRSAVEREHGILATAVH